jgi:hypothetical protein
MPSPRLCRAGRGGGRITPPGALRNAASEPQMSSRSCQPGRSHENARTPSAPPRPQSQELPPLDPQPDQRSSIEPNSAASASGQVAPMRHFDLRPRACERPTHRSLEPYRSSATVSTLPPSPVEIAFREPQHDQLGDGHISPSPSKTMDLYRRPAHHRVIRFGDASPGNADRSRAAYRARYRAARRR